MAKPSGGRTFSRTCLVKGREDEGRLAIIKRGTKRTRVAPIRSDGRTDDGAVVIANDRILDVREVGEAEAPPVVRTGIVGDRGGFVLPADIRRRNHLEPGSPFLIEEREEGVLIRPAQILPRRPTPALETLLEGITPDTVHPETDTGPSTGRESW